VHGQRGQVLLAQLPVPTRGKSAAQLGEDLPVVELAVFECKRGRRVLGDVAHGGQVEREVVVASLNWRHRWQDDVCVAARLVDEEVDRHRKSIDTEKSSEAYPRSS